MPKKKSKKKPKKTGLSKKLAPKTRTTRKSAKKKPAARAKLSKKKPAAKKAHPKTRTARTKKAAPAKKRIRTFGSLDAEPLKIPAPRAQSGGQSGDLQGLSDVESADSESVDELIEEGNAFEADVVAGVESAGGDNEEKEVHTHEVLQDDVPEEYLDQD